MEAEQRIKNYILPRRGGWLFCLILTAAMALCIIAGIVLGFTVKPPTASFNSARVEGSEWCTLEIVGVSDWVYRHDSEWYHIAEGSDGEFYVVQLSQAKYKTLKDQQAYWNEEGPARPVTLRGMSENIGMNIINNFTKALDLGFGTSFRSIFGTRFLDTEAKPNDSVRYPLLLIGAFGGLFGLIPLLTINASRKRGAANLERVGSYGMSRAAAELDSAETVRSPDDRLRVGPSYIFGRRNGLLVPCEDVFWCYQRVQKTYGVVSGRSLMLYTRDGGSYVAATAGRKGDGDILGLLEVIGRRCPNVRLGFSPENRDAWAAHAKELKKK